MANTVVGVPGVRIWTKTFAEQAPSSKQETITPTTLTQLNWLDFPSTWKASDREKLLLLNRNLMLNPAFQSLISHPSLQPEVRNVEYVTSSKKARKVDHTAPVSTLKATEDLQIWHQGSLKLSTLRNFHCAHDRTGTPLSSQQFL